MLPSRRLLQVLPRRTFTTSLPRLSPVRCQKAHSHPHPPPTQRTALLLQQHPSHCGVQIRQNSTEATKKTSTTDKKIPPFIQSGDWMCSRCQAHNYRTRTICFECQSPIQEGRVFYMEGSWNCPTCSLYVPRTSLSLRSNFHYFQCLLLGVLLCGFMICVSVFCGFGIRRFLQQRLNVDHANHCKRCMTKKDTSYEYPLRENDISIPLTPIAKINF